MKPNFAFWLQSAKTRTWAAAMVAGMSRGLMGLGGREP